MFERIWPILLGVAIGILIRWVMNRYYRIKEIHQLMHAPLNKKGLKEGWAINPALKYPGHYPCFCGSGAKFRKCCFKTLPRYVKESSLPKINKELENCQRFVKANLGKLKRGDRHSNSKDT